MCFGDERTKTMNYLSKTLSSVRNKLIIVSLFPKNASNAFLVSIHMKQPSFSSQCVEHT